MISTNEVAEVVSTIDTFLQQVKSQVSELLEQRGEEARVRDIVEVTRGVCREVARRTVESLVEQRGRGYEGPTRPCGCGGSQHFVRDVYLTINTVVGPIRVKRASYRCACGQTRMGDEEFHERKAKSYSDEFVEAITLTGMLCGSYKEASDMLARLLEQSVTAKAVERLIGVVAGEVVEQRDQQVQQVVELDPSEDAERKPKRVVIEIDGSMINTRSDGWREVKLAQIYDQDCVRECPQREPAEDVDEDERDPPRREIERSRFVGHLGSAEEFEDMLVPALVQEGVYQARHVAVVGDGAAWIWNRAEALVGGATQILDWWHLLKHLWSCGHELYGEDTEETKTWVATMREKLWNGDIDGVISELQTIYTSTQDEQDAVDDLKRYLTSNKQRMHYPAYRARGLPIGSGAIESSNKRVIGGRLKQAGMRWTNKGATHMIELRCRYYSDTWDDIWAHAA